MATVTCNTSTYINSTGPTINYNGSDLHCLDYVSGTQKNRILLRFDVSAWGAGSGGLLYLKCISFYTSATLTFYRLTQTGWTEAGATWNKYDGTTNWTTAGGDYTATGALAFTSITATGWVALDISSLVVDAIANRAGILNIIGIVTGQGNSPDGYIFTDDESAGNEPYLIQAQLKTVTSTSTGSQTFTKAATTQPFYLANNNQAYVLNVETGAWTFIDNHPFTSMIYRPLYRTVLGARRDEGDVCTINSGNTFDLTTINWSFQTGFFNFGELDEIKEMQPNASEALKRVRALFSEVKASGNITLTVYTENDSTGKTFTITPATADNTVYNMVRTALSRDIRGKYVSFKFSGSTAAWIGETGLKIAPRGIR